MDNFINKRVIKILLAIIIFLAGTSSGWFLKVFFHKDGQNVIRIREASNYRFINPLLAVDTKDKDRFKEIWPLHAKIEDYAKKKVEDGDVLNISFYFRDLISGHWTGVNEDEKFSPASMLKVVTLIAYLKLAETDPPLLSRKLYYDGQRDRNLLSYYKPASSLIAGSYAVEDLLTRMIVDSGNNSDYVLKQNIKVDDLLKVYTHLQLPLPKSEVDDFMSAKEYSIVFRVLYNSTYLSREMSEKALTLLSKTAFNKGLSSGIGSGFSIADKFGERTIIGPDGKIVYHELHDCGIIYVPNPYFLCVMTKGDSFEKLAEVISHISSLTFSFVSKTGKYF